MPLQIVKVGTRGSALALAQTRSVQLALKKKYPRLQIETAVIKTTGDKIKDVPLSQIGMKALFIKEIEDSLLRGEIDFAVHSLKDLPTEVPDGLGLGAVMKREDPHDCLISYGNYSLKTLPRHARVGTSSLRRKAQILSLRPDLQVESLRGNLDTRIQKLQQKSYDAIVVAWAGVKRLKAARRFKLSPRGEIKISKIPFAEMLPAVGQGSLAIEIRENDPAVESLVRALQHRPSYLRAVCERAFLRTLQGGCQVPVGVISELKGKKIILEGMIADLTGRQVIRKKLSMQADQAEELGNQLALQLLNAGGEKILDGIRS